jgi:hypothetical protein
MSLPDTQPEAVAIPFDETKTEDEVGAFRYSFLVVVL